MTFVHYEVLRKTVAVKNLKISFQVVNFSRYRMDLFFRQLRVAIRRINFRSQGAHTTEKFLESYFSHYFASSHILNEKMINYQIIFTA